MGRGPPDELSAANGASKCRDTIKAGVTESRSGGKKRE